jgi:hypothetical protein
MKREIDQYRNERRMGKKVHLAILRAEGCRGVFPRYSRSLKDQRNLLRYAYQV